jgi:hypothetical protein
VYRLDWVNPGQSENDHMAAAYGGKADTISKEADLRFSMSRYEAKADALG